MKLNTTQLNPYTVPSSFQTRAKKTPSTAEAPTAAIATLNTNNNSRSRNICAGDVEDYCAVEDEDGLGAPTINIIDVNCDLKIAIRGNDKSFTKLAQITALPIPNLVPFPFDALQLISGHTLASHRSEGIRAREWRYPTRRLLRARTSLPRMAQTPWSLKKRELLVKEVELTHSPELSPSLRPLLRVQSHGSLDAILNHQQLARATKTKVIKKAFLLP